MNQKLAAPKITGSNTSQVFLLAISACAGIVLSLLVWMILAPLGSFAAFIMLETMPVGVYFIAFAVIPLLLLLGSYVSFLDAFRAKDNKKYVLCGLGFALLVTGIRFFINTVFVYTKTFH